MDAHPVRGKELYSEYCSRCHGGAGQSNAGKVIPALAGQRFTYRVRQLANFAGAERESRTMQGVAVQPAINDPQEWVNIAAYFTSNAHPVMCGREWGPGRICPFTSTPTLRISLRANAQTRRRVSTQRG